MKADIIAALEEIAGDALAPGVREEIANRVIKICEDQNRAKALTAVETVRQVLENNRKTDK